MDVSINIDIVRKIYSSSLYAKTDTKRIVALNLEIAADATRNVFSNYSFNADVSRKIQTLLKDYEKMTISLDGRRLSDRISATIVGQMNISDNVATNVADFQIDNYKVRRITRKNGRDNLDCQLDISETLLKPIKIGNLSSASSIIGKLASELGKAAHIYIDNFHIVAFEESESPTYQDVVSRLFSWTESVPHMQINFFQRGKDFYIIQRGKEPATYTIDDIKDGVVYNSVSQNLEIVRTIQEGADTQGNSNSSSIYGENSGGATQYYTGTDIYKDISLEYVNGFVIKEIKPTTSGEIQTTETIYDRTTPPARPTKRTITVKAGSLVTQKIEKTYEYQTSRSKELVLFQEIEKTYDGDNISSTKTTTYTEQGQGRFAMTIEVDGVIVNDDFPVTPPSGEESPYSISRTSYGSSRPTANLKGKTIQGISFPITNIATLNAIAAGLEWLDGKTKETLDLELRSNTTDHILDFDEKIIYHGSTYYLDSNQITIDKKGISQSISLVRWF